MRIIEQNLLLLLTLFLPIQLGKHFWPHFSFVTGIRIDYLSPIFYATDILIVLLIAAFFFRTVFIEKKVKKEWFIVLFGTLIVLMMSFLSSSISEFGAYVYGILRVTEYVMLAIAVSEIVTKELFRKIVLGVSLISIFIVGLECIQFYFQGSIGGLFYWAGERNFSLSTPSIARFTQEGHLLLRPYGTFPHPNVMAFYLFFSMLLSLYGFETEKLKIRKLFFGISIVLLFTGILFSFSRVYIFCAFLLLILKTMKSRWSSPMLVGMVVFSMLFSNRLFSPDILNGFSTRISHLLSFSSLVRDHVLFGSGWNQYFYYPNAFNNYLSDYFFQPPHNMFMLILLQIGIIGLVWVTLGIVWSIKRAYLMQSDSNRDFAGTLLVTILFASFFDHYFITLHQGMVLTALSFGIIWSPLFGTKE